MGLEFVNPENAPPPAANYSNLAIVPAGYRLLVIAGQIGNLADGSIVEGLEAQYEQAISNINTIVASEGGDSKNIARITVFLAEKPTSRDMIGAAMENIFQDGGQLCHGFMYLSYLAQMSRLKLRLLLLFPRFRTL